MHDDRDPLTVLSETKDPREAAEAIRELAAAGFTDPLKIAADFGWVIGAA